MMSAQICILNGPNLNLLGQRQPELYGSQTLADIRSACEAKAQALGYVLRFEQSNHEGALVDWIHQARNDCAGLIINAGALTHTSAALYDAMLAFEKPSIELHISNVHAREAFRHHSFLSPAVNAVMCGFGAAGYGLAMDGLHQMLTGEQS
jgi:3-dehydroquinate dehydratase-2